MKEGVTSHGMQAALIRWGNQGSRFSLEPPGGTQLYWRLDSPQWNPSQTFDLQNCKIICLSSAGLKLFLFSSLKLDWESGWVGFQIGNHFPSAFWGIADFSSFQRQEVDTVLMPPPLCGASFILLLLASFFIPCVLKFYKIVGLFHTLYWLLSGLFQSGSYVLHLGYCLALFSGKFPPPFSYSLFWKFLLRIGSFPRTVLSYFFCFAIFFWKISTTLSSNFY